jgi:molybdopterin converting factor subunit 1
MRITIKLFAVLRERAATDETSLELTDGATVRVAVDSLAERIASIRELLPHVAFAVNRTYVKPDTILNDGDELALIPPVSGG